MNFLETSMTLNTRSAETAVDFALLRKHFFSNDKANDDIKLHYLKASEEYFQGFTGMQLMQATYTYNLSHWPFGHSLWLPFPSLQSVQSVTYVDANDQQQSLDPGLYNVDHSSFPGRVLLQRHNLPHLSRHDYIFPKVSVNYTSGFDDADDCPSDAKQAIMLLAADWFATREDTVLGKAPTSIPNGFLNTAVRYKVINPDGHYHRWKYPYSLFPLEGFYVGGLFGW